MNKKKWSDKSLLKAIKNPGDSAYEVKIKVPELTFEGVRSQPDFAKLYITFYPKDNAVELKSLKEYVYHFRDKILSYERLINVIYDDLMDVYDPIRLRLVMICNARGGISSKLTVDSDWKIRGGDEKFCDWVGQKEEW
jgi:7-cyano-7-deazaguanine reductase